MSVAISCLIFSFVDSFNLCSELFAVGKDPCKKYKRGCLEMTSCTQCSRCHVCTDFKCSLTRMRK